MLWLRFMVRIGNIRVWGYVRVRTTNLLGGGMNLGYICLGGGGGRFLHFIIPSASGIDVCCDLEKLSVLIQELKLQVI